jgi:hypothetical protein
MPVVPTTAYSQAEDALTLARALMNDSSGAVFTDALLMPLLNSAYRGLQRELAENGVSVLGEQQDIDLEPDPSSGVTNMEISDTSSPQLPSDCLMPQMLWERATANTSDTRRTRSSPWKNSRAAAECSICNRAHICGCGNGARIKLIW